MDERRRSGTNGDNDDDTAAVIASADGRRGGVPAEKATVVRNDLRRVEARVVAPRVESDEARRARAAPGRRRAQAAMRRIDDAAHGRHDGVLQSADKRAGAGEEVRARHAARARGETRREVEHDRRGVLRQSALPDARVDRGHWDERCDTRRRVAVDAEAVNVEARELREREVASDIRFEAHPLGEQVAVLCLAVRVRAPRDEQRSVRRVRDQLRRGELLDASAQPRVEERQHSVAALVCHDVIRIDPQRTQRGAPTAVIEHGSMQPLVPVGCAEQRVLLTKASGEPADIVERGERDGVKRRSSSGVAHLDRERKATGCMRNREEIEPTEYHVHFTLQGLPLQLRKSAGDQS